MFHCLQSLNITSKVFHFHNQNHWKNPINSTPIPLTNTASIDRINSLSEAVKTETNWKLLRRIRKQLIQGYDIHNVDLLKSHFEIRLLHLLNVLKLMMTQTALTQLTGHMGGFNHGLLRRLLSPSNSRIIQPKIAIQKWILISPEHKRILTGQFFTPN